MNNNIIEKFKEIQLINLSIFQKKNIDYGNSFEKYGLIGLLIRINDKINRCITIDKNKVELIDEETLKDTLMDLSNYCIIASTYLK